MGISPEGRGKADNQVHEEEADPVSRGGSGRVSIDSALLARLKAETAPRLTYNQVAARLQSRSAAKRRPPAAHQIGSVVQQLAPLIGAVVNRRNNGNYGGGYDYGRYPGPGYCGPGPVYTVTPTAAAKALCRADQGLASQRLCARQSQAFMQSCARTPSCAQMATFSCPT